MAPNTWVASSLSFKTLLVGPQPSQGKHVLGGFAIVHSCLHKAMRNSPAWNAHTDFLHHRRSLQKTSVRVKKLGTPWKERDPVSPLLYLSKNSSPCPTRTLLLCLEADTAPFKGTFKLQQRHQSTNWPVALEKQHWGFAKNHLARLKKVGSDRKSAI